MASGDQFPGPDGSISDVLKAVSMELHGLIARRDEVANRIRDVRSAVEALRRFHGAGVKDQSANADRRNPCDLRLRRACRIALLETNEGMSEQEICQRIVRRGSYSFRNPQVARLALIRELRLLEEQGELCSLYAGSRQLWKRTSR